MFSDLTEDVDGNVFTEDDVILETEDIIDLWIASGLIVRHNKKLNNQIQEAYLNDWATSTSEREKLFEKLQHPGYMQKMLVWNKMKRIEMQFLQ